MYLLDVLELSLKSYKFKQMKLLQLPICWLKTSSWLINDGFINKYSRQITSSLMDMKLLIIWA